MRLDHRNRLTWNRGGIEETVPCFLHQILKRKGLFGERRNAPEDTQTGSFFDCQRDPFCKQSAAWKIGLRTEDNKSSLIIAQHQVRLANAVIDDLSHPCGRKAAQEIVLDTLQHFPRALFILRLYFDHD